MNTSLIIINGKEVAKITYKNLPVMTLRMVDEIHCRPSGTAGRNFRENRDKLVLNEDFFEVTYDEWSKIPIDEFRRADHHGQRNSIIFLSQHGYLMLVKSFTDKFAWKIQKQLVDCYFTAKSIFESDDFKTFAKAAKAEIDAIKHRNYIDSTAYIEANKIFRGEKTLEDYEQFPLMKAEIEKQINKMNSSLDENIGKWILEGAESALRYGLKPTYKVLANRKPKLKHIKKKEFDRIAEFLQYQNRIRIDKSKGKDKYYPV